MAKEIQFQICTADGGGPKKHPCPECTFCQFCPDDRCKVCLKDQKCRGGSCKTKVAGAKKNIGRRAKNKG